MHWAIVIGEAAPGRTTARVRHAMLHCIKHMHHPVANGTPHITITHSTCQFDSLHDKRNHLLPRQYLLQTEVAGILGEHAPVTTDDVQALVLGDLGGRAERGGERRDVGREGMRGRAERRGGKQGGETGCEAGWRERVRGRVERGGTRQDGERG